MLHPYLRRGLSGSVPSSIFCFASDGPNRVEYKTYVEYSTLPGGTVWRHDGPLMTTLCSTLLCLSAVLLLRHQIGWMTWLPWLRRKNSGQVWDSNGPHRLTPDELPRVEFTDRLLARDATRTLTLLYYLCIFPQRRTIITTSSR